MEKVAVARLDNHLRLNGVLHPLQSAYRRYSSTETAALQVTSEWRKALDTGHVVCVASLEISAAFDTVNHPTLLSRLIQAGVVGRAYKWIGSYLSDRKTVVKRGECPPECLKGQY